MLYYTILYYTILDYTILYYIIPSMDMSSKQSGPNPNKDELRASQCCKCSMEAPTCRCLGLGSLCLFLEIWFGMRMSQLWYEFILCWKTRHPYSQALLGFNHLHLGLNVYVCSLIADGWNQQNTIGCKLYCLLLLISTLACRDRMRNILCVGYRVPLCIPISTLGALWHTVFDMWVSSS